MLVAMDAPTTRWTNPSVRQLLSTSGAPDPTEIIAAKAQNLALTAMENGWAGPPFDPFDLARYLDVSVVARNDVDDARLTMSDRGPRIEFNPARRAARVRFSVAHELAHLLFDDYADQVRERHAPELTESDDWQLEMLCNIGASEFLMPAGAFPKERVEDLSLAHLLDLRTRFGVSTEAVLRRVVRLTERPAAIFVATLHDDSSATIDYAVASRSWRAPVQSGWSAPEDSVLRRITAVGFSLDAVEHWDGHEVRVQAVGVPPYQRHRFPRLIGLLTPTSEADRIEAASITYVRGDAIEPDTSPNDVLVHVVNNAARTWGGRGFAAALRRAFPELHDSYEDWASQSKPQLGTVHWATTSTGMTVASLVAQAGYGDDDRVRLRLGALHRCLSSVGSRLDREGGTVHMPLIGTGYGGVRWPTVRDLVLDDLCFRGVAVTVYIRPDAVMPGEADTQLTLLS
jgi:O-acetyl-ADP-ribose deacetylase (regulator of RNase III)